MRDASPSELCVASATGAVLRALHSLLEGGQSRLDDFRTARQAIESDDALDATERDRRVQHMLEERFTPAERLRVQALDATSGH